MTRTKLLLIHENLCEGNVNIDLWEDGLINITTTVFIPNEHAKLEILEQVHNYCPFNMCPRKDSCHGHCDKDECISYIRTAFSVPCNIKECVPILPGIKT